MNQIKDDIIKLEKIIDELKIISENHDLKNKTDPIIMHDWLMKKLKDSLYHDFMEGRI